MRRKGARGRWWVISNNGERTKEWKNGESIICEPLFLITKRICQWKKKDRTAFRSALQADPLFNDVEAFSSSTATDIISSYETVMLKLVDSFLLQRTVRSRQHPHSPWFNADCRALRRQARHLGRVYRRTRVYHRAWRLGSNSSEKCMQPTVTEDENTERPLGLLTSSPNILRNFGPRLMVFLVVGLLINISLQVFTSFQSGRFPGPVYCENCVNSFCYSFFFSARVFCHRCQSISPQWYNKLGTTKSHHGGCFEDVWAGPVRIRSSSRSSSMTFFHSLPCSAIGRFRKPIYQLHRNGQYFFPNWSEMDWTQVTQAILQTTVLSPMWHSCRKYYISLWP